MTRRRLFRAARQRFRFLRSRVLVARVCAQCLHVLFSRSPLVRLAIRYCPAFLSCPYNTSRQHRHGRHLCDSPRTMGGTCDTERGWNQATLVTRRLELTPSLLSVRRSLQDHQVRQGAGRQAVRRGCGGHGRVQGWCAAPLTDAARLHLLSRDSTSLRPGMPLGRPRPRLTTSWHSSTADPAASVCHPAQLTWPPSRSRFSRCATLQHLPKPHKLYP